LKLETIAAAREVKRRRVVAAGAVYGGRGGRAGPNETNEKPHGRKEEEE